MGGWNPCITGAPHLHPHCHLPHLLSLTVLSLHWHCLSAPSVCTSLCCLSMPSFCISLHCLCASLCHLLYAVSLHLLMPSLCLPTLSLCTISLHCLSVLSPYTISLHHLSTPSVCTSCWICKQVHARARRTFRIRQFGISQDVRTFVSPLLAVCENIC